MRGTVCGQGCVAPPTNRLGCRSVLGRDVTSVGSGPSASPRWSDREGMADAEATEYTQDGPVAQKIAAVIPYYKFKGIPRFYDINGFLIRPDIFQLVIDVFAARYKGANLTSSMTAARRRVPHLRFRPTPLVSRALAVGGFDA